MPTYTYECGACKHKGENIRRIADRHDPLACPRCSNEMRLALSLFSAHTWTPLELELETNVLRTYESKRELKRECTRLGKSMPAWDF